MSVRGRQNTRMSLIWRHSSVDIDRSGGERVAVESYDMQGDSHERSRDLYDQVGADVGE